MGGKEGLEKKEELEKRKEVLKEGKEGSVWKGNREEAGCEKKGEKGEE